MDGKIIFGYQGWFSAPGDGFLDHWWHWSRDFDNNFADIGPGLYAVDMWPDVSELDEDELFDAPNVTLLDGSTGRLFSSANPKTVDRHFRWMKEYGIDGVIFQRFVAGLEVPVMLSRRNQVFHNVQNAADRHGRVWALQYDGIGLEPATTFQSIVDDWQMLNDTFDFRNDDQYLHHLGKPVVGIFGFGLNISSITPAIAAAVIDYLQNDPVYGGNTVMGGIPTYWRTLTNDSHTDPDWAAVYRSLDIISPWMVGRFSDSASMASIRDNVWIPDLSETQSQGILYMPVVWPGFSWDNLMELPPGTSLFPRNGGTFYWEQVYTLKSIGVNTLLNAMFDEVDEGTAMFKISYNHPVTDNWITLDGYPTDWYLQLGSAATRMIRGDTALTDTIPIVPRSGQITSNLPAPFIEEGSRLVLTAPDTQASPPMYQWKKGGANLVDETSRTLVFDPVTTVHEGTYTVAFDNGLAKVQVITIPFVLSILPAGSVPVTGIVGLIATLAGLITGSFVALNRKRFRR